MFNLFSTGRIVFYLQLQYPARACLTATVQQFIEQIVKRNWRVWTLGLSRPLSVRICPAQGCTRIACLARLSGRTIFGYNFDYRNVFRVTINVTVNISTCATRWQMHAACNVPSLMSFQAQQSKISEISMYIVYYTLCFTFWPVVEYRLGDVPRRIAGAKQELFRLPADQNQPQINLQTKTLI